jgi:hypothetical protein
VETGPGEAVSVESDPAGAPGATLALSDSVARIGIGKQLAKAAPVLIAIVAVGLVAAGQLSEDAAADPFPRMIWEPISLARWSVVAAVLYMLVISHILDRTVLRSRESLKRALQVDDAAFQPYALQMRHPQPQVDVALLVASALVVYLLFAVLKVPLPISAKEGDRPLLSDGPNGAFIVAGYAIVGWAVLRLFYVTTRMARVLGHMSHQPLDINVFDTTNLLPFGNLALTVALAPVGVIVILVTGLGTPHLALSWGVLTLATVASVLALLLPIRGTHRQMVRAKRAVLARINGRIQQVYDEFIGTSTLEAVEMARLANRTNTLIPLRKTVQEMTTWPFRDTVTFGRAVVIASAPVFYAALIALVNELVKRSIPPPP